MTPSAEPPRFRTGVLWAVLALLMLGGIVAAAYFVYGLSELLSHPRYLWDLPAIVAGGFLSSVTLLLITGILYRVDRLRGTPHRTVVLFE